MVFLDVLSPVLQGFVSLGEFVCKRFQGFIADYPHITICSSWVY